MKKSRNKLNQKHYQLILLYVVAVFVLGVGVAGWNYVNQISSEFQKVSPLLVTKNEPKKSTQETTRITLPSTYNLTVPYVPQAPFNNWAVHEESCEEAALLMYHEYLTKTSYPNNRVPDAAADAALRAMKSWQVTNYGAERDLTMEVLGKLAKDYFSLTSHVSSGITDKDIKTAIFDGSPVLVPVMTHSLLNNMYGPYTVYHVLMIKGYDATGVITNDAGVGNGPDHHYDWSVLWSAIDAQTSKMGQGRVMLTLSK